MVCFVQGKPDKSNYRLYRIRTVEKQDDFASMAEVVRRRYSRILTEGFRKPNLIMVDGGKGQLSSALRELAALNLSTLPVIGLAKEREEIYRPGERIPLVLDQNSGALRLLQRVRDEAHRCANGYHQLLMKQRVKESVLDDCPGVSDARKKRLLQAFSSVERLRAATVEQVAAVEGIGPKLAETLVDFLHKAKKQTIEVSEVPVPSAPKENEVIENEVIYRLKSKN